MWLIWRQHRTETLFLAAALAAAAAVLLPTGVHLHHLFHSSGAAACLASGADPGLCNARAGEYTVRYQHLTNIVAPFLIVLPGALGVFVGAPLLGREFDEGTWQLAWSQSVPRTRWLRAKLLYPGAVVLASTALLAWLFTWWYGPATAIKGRLNATFSAEGAVYPAHALFAFALGALAGALLRRTEAAMAATIGAYLAVRVPVEARLRMRLLPPRHLTVTGDQLAALRGPRAQDRVLGHRLVDGGGRPWPSSDGTTVTRDDLPRFMHAHGLRMRYTYQPAGRFWPLQWIEAGIFAVLAALLLTVLVVRVRGRAI